MAPRFEDRSDAGRRLAEALSLYADQNPLVIGLPRGGVPVAHEVAKALDASLDVYVVQKLGAPGHPELGMGAVGPGGVRVLNEDVVQSVGASKPEVERLTRQKSAEVEERLRRFRGDLPPLDVSGRVVIVVDDGVATGGTARVTLRALRAQSPERLVLAVPVGPPSVIAALREEVDELVVLEQPDPFMAVGYWYRDFRPTSDDDVARVLQLAHRQHPLSVASEDLVDPDVVVPAGDVTLDATLSMPKGALAVVVFAHGAGSGRVSPRNRQVAAVLNEHGLATVLVDLLTMREQTDPGEGPGFDVTLLADRVLAVARWLGRDARTRGLPVGVIGSSTGAAVALAAAARATRRVQSVVSRGGRPDLAGDLVRNVEAPTLFIVGGLDVVSESVSREAMDAMVAPRDLVLVPGASHLFEEPGTLDEAARLAAGWFTRFLVEHAVETPAAGK